MKKTLIALAAVASVSASYAQVTMAGKLGFTWQQSPVVAADGSHVQGLSMNDGEIYVTAMEDLGGGMSATARGGFTMRGRGTSIADRDGTITLAGPSGALTVGNVRSCGPLDAVKSGAVTGTVYEANEKVNEVPLDKCSLIDVVTYTSPKMGDVTVNATYGEFNNSAGTDQKGNATGLTFTVLGATYATGPIMLTGDVTSYMSAQSTSQTGALSLKPLDGWMRTRIAGTYDMQVAKFGLGYQTWTWGKADQMIASVAVPMGNAVFGIDYMARAAQGSASKGSAADNTAVEGVSKALSSTRAGDVASSALGVGVTYNFSKTTNLNASYITYNDAGKNVDPTTGAVTYSNSTATFTSTKPTMDTEYRIRLTKSF